MNQINFVKFNQNLILILLFLLLLVTSVFAEVVYVDQEVDVGGRKVIVNNIGSNSVVIKVGEVKDLVTSGTTKEIAGIRITVNQVFYVEERESRYADISFSSAYFCGDGECTAGIEDSTSCCTDCRCSGEMTCNDNQCGLWHLNKCSGNDDCDDKNDQTFDICTGSPRKCVNNLVVECSLDEGCKDDDPCTLDVCEYNECFNKKQDGCVSGGTANQQTDDSVEGSPDNSEENVENQEETNVGFFGRVINWFKGWFN